MSGTIIRATQINMENHPTSPFKGENQQKRDELNSLLIGLQQDIWANPPISPLHPRPHSEESRNTSDSPEASALGCRTHDDITASSEPQNWHCPSPPRPRSASDAAPPLACSRPPVTSPTFLRLPNRTGQEWPGSNHHAIVRNRHEEELLTTMPPILALCARFVPAQCTKQPP
jgi:hypothetical protein